MPYKNPQKQKEYYEKNKEKLIARSRLNYAENREDRIKKSREHYQKIRPTIITGEGSGHGRGKKFTKGFIPWNKGLGNTTENHRIRTSLDYTLWRKAVFERDNFTCQLSGVSGGELVVHHINNFADFPELRMAIDNGITMNKNIHKLFHKKFGVKNNTKEQLAEFAEDLLFNPSNDYIIHI